MNCARHAVAGAVAITLLAGCSAAGNEKLGAATRQALQQQLTQGVTTKAQLEATLGPPNSVTFERSREQWTYEYSHSTPGLITFVPVLNLFVRQSYVRRKQLVVLFDEQDVIDNYAYTDGTSTTKFGLGP